MPRMNEIEKEAPKNFRRPTTLDREQLEYSATKMLTYGVILFAALGTCASIAYMTVQQLRK
jgi:hypothetical protein